MKIIASAIIIMIALGGVALGFNPAVGNRPGIQDHKKILTPYGDYCTLCSKYGKGGKPIKVDAAIEAVEHYFKNKGITVKNVVHKRRFIMMDLYKNEQVVDKIIFDRRTGRVRSID